MRFFITVFTGLALLITGCKGDGDVLAVYKDGNITRGDFYSWIDANHLRKESILKNKKQQIDKLQRLALEKIAVVEAKKAGFEKSKDFKVVADMATEKQLMKIFYERKLKDKADFKEPVVKLSHIYLRVRDFKIEKSKKVRLSEKDLAAEFETTMKKAKEIIDKLNKGEKFEALAEKYSNDFSRKKGGDIGYKLEDVLPDEYAKIAFSLKEGEYTKEPLKLYSTDRRKLPNGVYIIKVTDKKELTSDNIEDIFDKKGEAKRLSSVLSRKSYENYVEKLMKADDVKIKFDNIKSNTGSDVLFKVGDLTYTVSDFNKRIDHISKRYRSGKRKMPDFGEKEKKRLIENILKFELLKRAAVKEGIDKEPEYIENVKNRVDQLLAREYIRTVGTDDVSISAKEVQDEYDKNKDKRYYKVEKDGKKKKKVIEPFDKVKDRIERMLKIKKRRVTGKKWEDEMLKKYSFKINETELEGD